MGGLIVRAAFTAVCLYGALFAESFGLARGGKNHALYGTTRIAMVEWAE